MRGPEIKDYLEVIENVRVTAQKEDKAFIGVNSKELHANVSPNHATMPTRCQAIHKLMLEGDEVLRRPKGSTDFGSRLTVRFHAGQLGEREHVFPNKKRGRPVRGEEEKPAARKAKMKRNTEDLCNLIKSWLGEHGWEYTENKNFIEAHNKSRHWVVNVQEVKRGRKQTLPVKLSEVLKHIEDTSAHCSVASNDSVSYHRQWSEVPKAVKNSLSMNVIPTDKKGNITEL